MDLWPAATIEPGQDRCYGSHTMTPIPLLAAAGSDHAELTVRFPSSLNHSHDYSYAITSEKTHGQLTQ